MSGLRPWILLLCPVLLLPGCAEETEERRIEVVQPAEEEEPLPEWLALNDTTPPEQWLAAQRLNQGASDTARIAELLKQGTQHYQESSRMLANRAYQLQQMLREADMAEDAIDLLERFLALPKLPHLSSFSANCQYYFNMRRQGLSPDEALEHLLANPPPVMAE